MQRILIRGENKDSEVLIGSIQEALPGRLPARGVFVITDDNVLLSQGAVFHSFPVYSIPPGEESKNLHQAGDIIRWLLNKGAERNSFILGIGGGVVCDIAGFVASTFMRGADFGFVATSLLAQTDASVGGKNGVNLDGFKNIIGTFHQPKFVVCDIHLLETLPDEEFLTGMAEVIKHALIEDAEMFARLEKQNINKIRCDKAFIEYIVKRSVEIKAGIVSADEKEKNIRRLLNLGHTWGHAIEKLTGISHGKAVGAGLVFSAEFSHHKGFLNEEEKYRIVSLIEKFGLIPKTKIDKSLAFNILLTDKKREGGFLYFVFMHGIGNARVEAVPVSEIKDFALK